MNLLFLLHFLFIYRKSSQKKRGMNEADKHPLIQVECPEQDEGEETDDKPTAAERRKRSRNRSRSAIYLLGSIRLHTSFCQPLWLVWYEMFLAFHIIISYNWKNFFFAECIFQTKFDDVCLSAQFLVLIYTSF